MKSWLDQQAFYGNARIEREVLPACLQLTLVDTTAMPLQGYVFLTALPGPNGYDPAWNAALASTQCMLPNITVCAYNAISNTQVRR